VVSKITFPDNRDSSRILIDLHIPAEYDYKLNSVFVHKTANNRIEGFSHQLSPKVWSSDAGQDYTVNFVIEFDQPIKKMGRWINDEIKYEDSIDAKDIANAGILLEFDTKANPVVQIRSGISLVSIANARENLETEVVRPFNWDFDAVRNNQKNVWNEIFNRVKITTTNRLEKIRFYNAMYRSVCSRNTWSDLNGEWKGTDGAVQKLKGKDETALGCDAFWNTFWNLTSSGIL